MFHGRKKKAPLLLLLLLVMPVRAKVGTRTIEFEAKFRGCKYWPLRRILRAERASSLGNPLACLKNNSKRRAASRLLTLGRISDEQIIKSRKRRVSIEGVWGRFIDDERVVSASLRICYLDRVGGDIEEGGIWEKRFLFGENFHIIVENNEYSFFFK